MSHSIDASSTLFFEGGASGSGTGNGVGVGDGVYSTDVIDTGSVAVVAETAYTGEGEDVKVGAAAIPSQDVTPSTHVPPPPPLPPQPLTTGVYSLKLASRPFEAQAGDEDEDLGPIVMPGAPLGVTQTPTFRRRMEADHTFTMRSLMLGLLLGSLIAAQNMYFFLKSGIGFPGTFTATLVGWGIIRLLCVHTKHSLPFTAKEHAFLTSVAVATGAGATAFGFSGPILAMTSGFVHNSRIVSGLALDIKWYSLIPFCLGLALFGLFLVVPFREITVVKNKLPFPSGRASASVIASLQLGSEHSRRTGCPTLIAAGVSFVVKVARSLMPGIDIFPIFGRPATCFGWSFDFSTAFMGASLIMPTTVSYGVMAGALLATIMSVSLLTKEGSWFPDKGSFTLPNGTTCSASLAPSSLDGVYGYVQVLAVAIFLTDGILMLFETVLLPFCLRQVRRWRRTRARNTRGGDGTHETGEDMGTGLLDRALVDPAPGSHYGSHYANSAVSAASASASMARRGYQPPHQGAGGDGDGDGDVDVGVGMRAVVVAGFGTARPTSSTCNIHVGNRDALGTTHNSQSHSIHNNNNSNMNSGVTISNTNNSNSNNKRGAYVSSAFSPPAPGSPSGAGYLLAVSPPAAAAAAATATTGAGAGAHAAVATAPPMTQGRGSGAGLSAGVAVEVGEEEGVVPDKATERAQRLLRLARKRNGGEFADGDVLDDGDDADGDYGFDFEDDGGDTYRDGGDDDIDGDVYSDNSSDDDSSNPYYDGGERPRQKGRRYNQYSLPSSSILARPSSSAIAQRGGRDAATSSGPGGAATAMQALSASAGRGDSYISDVSTRAAPAAGGVGADGGALSGYPSDHHAFSFEELRSGRRAPQGLVGTRGGDTQPRLLPPGSSTSDSSLLHADAGRPYHSPGGAGTAWTGQPSRDASHASFSSSSASSSSSSTNRNGRVGRGPERSRSQVGAYGMRHYHHQHQSQQQYYGSSVYVSQQGVGRLASGNMWKIGVFVSGLVVLVTVPLVLSLTDSTVVPSTPELYLSTIIVVVLSPLIGFVVLYTYGKSDQALITFGGKVFVALAASITRNPIVGLGLSTIGLAVCTQLCENTQMMKTAHLVKSSTRTIFYGQLVGAVFSVPASFIAYELFSYSYKLPDPSQGFDAPVAGLFRTMATLFAKNDDDLPRHYWVVMLLGALYAIFYHVLKQIAIAKGWTKPNSLGEVERERKKEAIAAPASASASASGLAPSQGTSLNSTASSAGANVPHAVIATAAVVREEPPCGVLCTFLRSNWFSMLPMPFAVALGLYIPAGIALDFALGAAVKLVWARANRTAYESHHQTVATGMISGEGLAGVFMAVVLLFVSIPWRIDI